VYRGGGHDVTKATRMVSRSNAIFMADGIGCERAMEACFVWPKSVVRRTKVADLEGQVTRTVGTYSSGVRLSLESVKIQLQRGLGGGLQGFSEVNIDRCERDRSDDNFAAPNCMKYQMKGTGCRERSIDMCRVNVDVNGCSLTAWRLVQRGPGVFTSFIAALKHI
jgi:hypothetical protein